MKFRKCITREKPMHFRSNIDTSRSRGRGIQLKLVIILKLGLRNILKTKTSLILLNICTPPQHSLTHVILFLLKIIDKANSKFYLQIKGALHINWGKPNLKEQQNHLAFTLSL